MITLEPGIQFEISIKAVENVYEVEKIYNEFREVFDKLLNEANVVGTPGIGFGPSGEGYFRLTAFGTKENTIEAIERIKNL